MKLFGLLLLCFSLALAVDVNNNGTPMGQSMTSNASPMDQSMNSNASPMDQSMNNNASPIGQSMYNNGSPIGQSMYNNGSPVVGSMDYNASPMVQSMYNNGSPTVGSMNNNGNSIVQSINNNTNPMVQSVNNNESPMGQSMYNNGSSMVGSMNSNTNPMVQSPIGSFRGSILKSPHRRDIYSFRGIRYANAPTGRNRFRQATPVQPQQGTFDATQEGPICPQPVYGNHYISEDCLRLNVYTPAIPTNSSTNGSNRPVFVFIHTGKMAYGSSYEYRPGFLLDRDAVLVTINYRKGALGFLSTGDSRAPGNAGLKDQVLALRWVQQNIQAFGGDPNSVVLLGDTAGAWAAGLHLLSPMSKGLFSRVIMMNKAVPFIDPLNTDELNVAMKQAQILGCPTDTLDNMFDCFYSTPAEDFGNSLPQMDAINIYTRQTFRPVVEPEGTANNRDESFLTMQPSDIIRSGGNNLVPAMLGNDYYNYIDKDTVKAFNYTAMDLLTKNFDKWAPTLFCYEHDSRAPYITQELKSFYLNNQPITTENYNDLFNLYDDALTNFPIHRFERMMATYSTSPVYLYWDYYSWCHPHPKWTNGAFFSYPYNNDLSYFFSMDGRLPLCQRDVENVEYNLDVILEFAKTGQVSGWNPSLRDQEQYLMCNSTQSTMVVGDFYPERMQKWDELFPAESDPQSRIEIDVYPIVHAPIGSFQGSISKSRNGKDISSFLGIRYAEAPTRETRFKQAAVVQPHEGTFNAINPGPICPQPVSGNKTISEDCLRLNVHTTLIPTNECNRPVFVFIHGGGFLTGSGSQYRPELMLDSEIVLVTINYRLGALGFLSTGDEYAPGNAGFKDQVLALRWIKQNIRAFGGDPNSVVLFGHEAGALSAAMHIFSPMSKGLFHRVIMMDGAPTLYKPLLTNQLDPAKKFAQVLGCSIDTRDNMFDCLYTKPAEDFGNSISQLTDVNLYLAPIFTPVLESAATAVNNDQGQ